MQVSEKHFTTLIRCQVRYMRCIVICVLNLNSMMYQYHCIQKTILRGNIRKLTVYNTSG